MQKLIQDDYSRQVNIFKPEEFTTPIHIIGAGATGSWITLSLAKMGVQNINVYDFDEVGMHNLPNQMFGVRDIGRNKALSINNIIQLFTGRRIKARNAKLEGGEPLQGIVFVLTDTMKSRKDIYYKSIKNNPAIELLIETRMDLRGGRIYTINPRDREQTKLYEETLYGDEEAEVSACGISQTVLPTALGIISSAIWQLLNYINNEMVYNEIIVDFSNNITMTQTWKNNKGKGVNIKELKDVCVLCDTEEKAKRLLEEYKKQGVYWNTGSDINPKDTRWEIYEKDTYYVLNGVDGKNLLYGNNEILNNDKRNVIHVDDLL